MDIQRDHGAGHDAPEAELVNVAVLAKAGAVAGRNAVVLAPNADNVVVLPEGATLDALVVDGRNLVLTMPDGRVFVIPDGAVYVPQIVVDGVEVPPLNLAALLTGNEPQPAAGAVQSSGGNFADPAGPIQAARGLGDLLPYTELAFPVERQEEVFQQPVDEPPSVVIGGPGEDPGEGPGPGPGPGGTPGTTDARQSVNEAGLPGERANGNLESPGSAQGSGSDTATGTIFITSNNPIETITINGIPVTGEDGQQIVTNLGVLTLGPLVDGRIAFSYTLTDNTVGDTSSDMFAVVITDDRGQSAEARLTIDVIDDVPVARPDTDAVAAGDFGFEEGNVLTGEGTTSGGAGSDTLGADGAAVTGIHAGTSGSFANVGGSIAGQYGSLVIKSDGSYTYQRAEGTPGGVTDVFTYRLTDGDGDISTATLTITIGDTTPAIVSVPGSGDAHGGEGLVEESRLAPNTATRVDEAAGSQFEAGPESTSGTINFRSDDGVGSVSLGGTAIVPGSLPQVVASDGTGTLVVTGYTFDPATGFGSLNYVYTLTDNTGDTDGTTLEFAVVVTDLDGDSATSTLVIDVIDDVPVARADAAGVVEGGQVSGNVTGNDTAGADGAVVTGAAAGTDTSAPVAGGADGVTAIQGAYGTLVIGAGGAWTYTSTPNAVPPAGAQDSFVYTLTDGDGDTSTTTLVIDLADAGFLASTETGTVAEAALATGSNPSSPAETTTGTLADNVTGGAGAPSFALVGSGTGSHGTLVLNANGGWSYTLTSPVDGATADNGGNTVSGVESFTYQVTDANGNTTTSTLVIDVIDDVPVARADAAGVVEGGQVSGNVTGNDTAGADGAVVTGAAAGTDTSAPVAGGADGVTAIQGAYGTLVIGAGGAWTYTSSPNAVPPAGASDSFVYTLTDGDGDTSTTTLVIDLSDAGFLASTETGTVAEAALATGSNPSSPAETATGTLADNVTGGAGAPSFALVGSGTGSHGTLVLNANGGWSYTLTSPVDGATADNGGNTVSGVESFTYQVTDANGNTTTGTLVIDVIDDVPVARADAAGVVEGGQVSGNVTGNDTAGADGAVVTGAAAGTDTSAPVAGGADGVTAIQGAYGTLVIGAGGAWTYTSSPNAVPPAGAQDSFVYTLTDGDGDTSTTTLVIDLADAGFLASTETGTVAEAALATGSNPSSPAETTTGTLADNVTGGAGAPSFALVGSGTGSHGTLVLNANGGWSYTLTSPVDGATADNGGNTVSGVESFTYQVTDANGNTTTSTLVIDVIDDVPVARADAAGVVEGGQVSGNVTGNDTAGADGAVVTGAAAGTDTSAPVAGGADGVTAIQGAYGTLVIGAGGAWTYTSSPNAVPPAGASDSFVYTLTDGDGDTSTTTLVIDLSDAGFLASTETGTVAEAALATGSNPSSPAETATGTLADNVTGGAGAPSFALVGSGTGSHGTLVLNANGGWSYTLTSPVDGATADNGGNTVSGVESFTYQVTDANGNTTTGTLVIDVIDDVPVARADAAGVVEGGQVSGNVTGNDTAGADGAVVTGAAAGTDTSAPVAGGADGVTAIQGAYGTLVIGAGGAWTYTSSPNAVPPAGASDSFVYTLTDGDGDTSTTTLVIDLSDAGFLASTETGTVAEAALATGSNPSSPAETATGTLADNVTGGAGAPSFALVGSGTGSHGTLVLNANGGWSYTLTSPVDGATADNGGNTVSGVESFTYQVTDANGNTTTGTLVIDVIDDVPVARADAAGVVEGGQVSGNVTGNDTAGADGAVVTGAAAGTDTSAPVAGGADGVTAIQGAYGTLVIGAGGAWTYTSSPNAVPPAGASDSFVYTLTDGDGDTSTTTLVIDLSNVTLYADNQRVLVDEAALDTATTGADLGHGTVTGSNPTSALETVTGQLNVTGAAGITYTPQSVTTAYGLFELNANGSYTYTLTKPFTTTPNANNGAAVEPGKEVFTYTATDANGNSVTGSIVVDIRDDVPVAAVPDCIVVTNAPSGSNTAFLDIDHTLSNNWGADGAGKMIFTAETIASLEAQSLTSGLAPLEYSISPDGLLLEAYKATDNSIVFTVALQPNGLNGQYQVSIVQKVDSLTTIDFNDAGHDFVGGNGSWAGFAQLSVNDSRDILLTPKGGGTVNTNANEGGVAAGNSVGSGEAMRVDYVIDLSGSPVSGGNFGQPSGQTQSFDGHYQVNGGSAFISKVTGTTTVTIAAFDDADTGTVKNVGDGTPDAITGIAIEFNGAQQTVSANGTYSIGGNSFTVTFNANGTASVAGVAEDTRIAAYTADGYNSIEWGYGGGSTFKIGDFGATTSTNGPVDFTVPVSIQDGDGDIVSSSALPIHLNPAVAPVALDLDGNGVQYLGLDAGVRFDYAGDGFAEQTAWVAGNDGLLAHANADGSLTIAFAGASGRTDLEALATQYDSNGDGELTADDSGFQNFGVWQDANSNGVVDAGEFRSLGDVGITAINLTGTGPGSVEAGGDVVVSATGQFTMNGKTYALGDASFATSGDSRIAARTTEIAAVSMAAAGFMALETAHAQALPPAAVQAVAATLQAFPDTFPVAEPGLPEAEAAHVNWQQFEAAPPAEPQAEPDRPLGSDSGDEGAAHDLGLGVTTPDHPAPVLDAPFEDHAAIKAHAVPLGNESNLMQALLLAAQSASEGKGEENGGDAAKPGALPAIEEALAENAAEQAVDAVIDHFAAHDGGNSGPQPVADHGAAGAGSGIEQLLGAHLAGGGLDGLHGSNFMGGLDEAALAATQAQAAAVA